MDFVIVSCFFFFSPWPLRLIIWSHQLFSFVSHLFMQYLDSGTLPRVWDNFCRWECNFHCFEFSPVGFHVATGRKMTIVMVLIKDFSYNRNLSNHTIFKIILLARVSSIFLQRGFSVPSLSTKTPFSKARKDSFLKTNLVQFHITGRKCICLWLVRNNNCMSLLLTETETGNQWDFEGQV